MTRGLLLPCSCVRFALVLACAVAAPGAAQEKQRPNQGLGAAPPVTVAPSEMPPLATVTSRGQRLEREAGAYPATVRARGLSVETKRQLMIRGSGVRAPVTGVATEVTLSPRTPYLREKAWLYANNPLFVSPERDEMQFVGDGEQVSITFKPSAANRPYLLDFSVYASHDNTVFVIEGADEVEHAFTVKEGAHHLTVVVTPLDTELQSLTLKDRRREGWPYYWRFYFCEISVAR